MNQHLVDYTVRNITTGDEEDIRVLELTDEEINDFPEAVRDEIQSLIVTANASHNSAALDARISWGEASEQIRQLLLPYISERELYDNDYETWEAHVLGEDDNHVIEALTTDNLPKYVNPAVLQPGQTVVALLDASQTRLVVLRVEPLVVCAGPDGKEITLFAHEVEPVEPALPIRPIDQHPTTMRYDRDRKDYVVTCPCGYAARAFEQTEAMQLMQYHAFHTPREGQS